MYWLYGLLIILFASTSIAGPKVLLFNSYNPQYQWTQANNQSILQVLSSEVADEDLHVEFMDSRRFSDDLVYRQVLARLYQHK